MNSFTHTYDKVYMMNVDLLYDGSCVKTNIYEYRRRETINKMACFDVTNIIDELYEKTCDPSIAPGSKLYVASECKTGRDTFRNSGYSIVRNPDKADAIIIPDIISYTYHRVDCNIVGYKESTDSLYLVYVRKKSLCDITTDDISRVEKFLAKDDIISDHVEKTSVSVWFLPKCDEIRDILSNNMLNVPYLQESKVPVSVATKISPETLVFWENIKDNNLLVRTICTSDWMDYPITLLVFLSLFRRENNWYNYANQDFRRILTAINYEYWGGFRLNNNAMLSPKDFDMLQRYIYYKFGIDENGGIIDANTFTAIPSSLLPLLNRKIALKPIHLSGPMEIRSVYSMILY